MKTSPKTPDAARWRELINRHLLGDISTEESIELESFLVASREAREDFRSRCNIDAALRQQASLQEEPVIATKNKIKRVWFSPTLTSAAAGLAFGMFCTSVAWAYVGPYTSKAITLLQESFESNPAPLMAGVPVTPGRWSGDATEVTGEQQGVKPENGKKMLRFLRADYEGKAKPQGSYVGDLYRLIDLRPSRPEIADGGAVVQVSAMFNSFAFPKTEQYGVSASAYALNAEMASNLSAPGNPGVPDEALAMTRKSLQRMDRDPLTWQKVEGELRLPSDTEFLLIHLSVIHATREQQRETFDGHFLDDVRVTLARRPPLR